MSRVSVLVIVVACLASCDKSSSQSAPAAAKAAPTAPAPAPAPAPAQPKGQTFGAGVTLTDGEMVFPMDSKGRKAIAEGVVAVTEMTLEQTKERAEYEAKEYGKPYDPASITEPAAVVRIDGSGAVFL